MEASFPKVQTNLNVHQRGVYAVQILSLSPYQYKLDEKDGEG